MGPSLELHRRSYHRNYQYVPDYALIFKQRDGTWQERGWSAKTVRGENNTFRDKTRTVQPCFQASNDI